MNMSALICVEMFLFRVVSVEIQDCSELIIQVLDVSITKLIITLEFVTLNCIYS